MSELRDYGLGDIQITGIPRFVEVVTGHPPCPNCGCISIAKVQIDVIDKRLTTGRGIGTYMSCVACPWASPMIAAASTKNMDRGVS